jgi:hypothetical protein
LFPGNRAVHCHRHLDRAAAVGGRGRTGKTVTVDPEQRRLPGVDIVDPHQLHRRIGPTYEQVRRLCGGNLHHRTLRPICHRGGYVGYAERALSVILRAWIAKISGWLHVRRDVAVTALTTIGR